MQFCSWSGREFLSTLDLGIPRFQHLSIDVEIDPWVFPSLKRVVILFVVISSIHETKRKSYVSSWLQPSIWLSLYFVKVKRGYINISSQPVSWIFFIRCLTWHHKREMDDVVDVVEGPKSVTVEGPEKKSTSKQTVKKVLMPKVQQVFCPRR